MNRRSLVGTADDEEEEDDAAGALTNPGMGDRPGTEDACDPVSADVPEATEAEEDVRANFWRNCASARRRESTGSLPSR